jgi:predicted transcriptional regulator
MKELTKAEEQVMLHIWKLEKAFLKDIVEEFPEPRPAYSTISTVIRVLVKKRFLGYKDYGKIHEYFPLVSKEAYFRYHFKEGVKNFFSGSVSSFASFFTDDKDLSITELEKMRALLEKKINDLKEKHE